MTHGRGVVLGVSGDFHDAAAALTVDGEILAAAEEERFSRIKHDASLPARSIEFCLQYAGLGVDDVEAVVFYEKPLSTYERVLVSAAKEGPRSLGVLASAVPVWSTSKLWVRYRLERLLSGLAGSGRVPPVYFAQHHQSHRASAYYPSPFDDAAILTIDGVGEWATTTIGHGRGKTTAAVGEITYPDSLGLLYSAFTAFCGFKVNDGEYKFMGLAPYGEPVHAAAIWEHLVHQGPDGAFRLDRRVFGQHLDPRRTARRLSEVLGVPSRPSGEPLTATHADVARSVQEVLETLVLGLARRAHDTTGASALCLAGGVALNCVANRRILEDGPFDDVWIQPAAGDSGAAIGAALWLTHDVWGRPRPTSTAGDRMNGAFLGPAFEADRVSEWLASSGIAHERPGSAGEVADLVAGELDRGAVVGWFTGRMEFGPRALGHRSILADPRDRSMVARINGQLKEREGFRPLAPAVLREESAAWFGSGADLAYMTITTRVRGADVVDDRKCPPLGTALGSAATPLPACTHVDGSARIQTVDRERNPEFHRLLEAFHRRTGCPVLLNTSFNGPGEPIVCSPDDAYRTFRSTGLDLLVIEDCVVRRGG